MLFQLSYESTIFFRPKERKREGEKGRKGERKRERERERELKELGWENDYDYELEIENPQTLRFINTKFVNTIGLRLLNL